MTDEVTTDPRIDQAQEGDPDDLIEVVVRLREGASPPEGLHVVAELGDVVTGRIRRGDIRQIHDAESVESLKLSERLIPERSETLDGAEEPSEGDDRRPTTDRATGRGSIVAVVDWYFDIPHQAFRRSDGRTRVLAFWDQRDTPGPGVRPARYGYGRVLDRDTIDRALQAPDPYAALAYRPWDGDPGGEGTHGTHVASIAAGSASVAPSGVAPECDLLLVHLVDRTRTEGAGLGSSVQLLEAIDWIMRTAGDRPWVVNLSMGRHADSHRGLSLVERALDSITADRPGRFCVQSAGNYYRSRVHTMVVLDPGDEKSVHWEIAAGDPTANEMEIWYPGPDSVDIEIRSPSGRSVRVAPGERGAITEGSREVCRISHRRADPNTGDNHAICFLDRTAPSGDWTVKLIGTDIVDGRCHLWIERDDPSGQSRFPADEAVVNTTTGSIANGFRTLAVGAYDAHDPQRPMGPFSSVGPTRDGRRKPNLVAPGVRVLAAKSAPAGTTRGTSATTRKSGTSMAAPHVTGTVALLYEAAGRPLSAREIRHLLVQSVDPPAAGVAERERYGHGYLNIDRALERTRALVPAAAARREEEGEERFVPEPALKTEADAEATFLRDSARLQSAPLAPSGPPLDPRSAASGVGRTYARIGGLIQAVGAELGVDPSAVLAVWQVESGGRGYTPGRTIIRVENHLLFDAWGVNDPATFDAHFQFGTRPPLDPSTTVCGRRPCDRRWRCHRSRQSTSDEFTCDHTSQARELEVLTLASRLAGEETALRCTSMGGPQILGSHHRRLGYASARAMRAAFESDERYEVLGFFDFCRGDARLLAALRDARWRDFARVYNGPGQVDEYARHVEHAYLQARALLGQAQQTPGHERWEPVQTLELTGVGGNGSHAETAELVAPAGTAVAVAEEPDPLVRVQHCPVDAYAYNRTGAVCSDGPQPGTRALRRLLRARFGERLAEIYNCRPVRGGTSLSLHAEGRAVDYYVNANDPQELEIGDQIVRWLLDPDDAGNPHAVARRLGVQEVIWNRRIWTAGARRNEGMRPYSGVDPHTNHVHVGQNRAGAAMQTTYWVGC